VKYPQSNRVIWSLYLGYSFVNNIKTVYRLTLAVTFVPFPGMDSILMHQVFIMAICVQTRLKYFFLLPADCSEAGNELQLDYHDMGTIQEELVRDALESKAQYAAVVDTARISFHEEFRKACERNACGRYNTCWVGPPAIGPIAELIAKVSKYPHGLLFQTVHQIGSSLDWKGMMAAAEDHKKIFRSLMAKISSGYHFQDILPLDAGCCKICKNCTYLKGKPCRHPDKAVSSVEAYGIDVTALEKEAGIPYYNGKNTVSYVGLILYRE
jgi:predicted metal-binding protein